MKKPAAPGDAELHAAERRAGAALEVDRVRALADDDLVAGARLRRDGELVAHRAARHEERRLLARDARHLLLEGVHGRVVAEDVVAHLGAGHGLAHRGRGAGDGVAAQVDHRRATLPRRQPDAVAESRALRSAA